MSNRRILSFSWLVITLSVFLLLRRLGQWIWIDLLGNAQLITTTDLVSASDIVVAVLVFGTSWICWRNTRIHEFSADVVTELRKVVFPTKEETKDNTVIVLITVAVIAVLLGGFDYMWANVTQFILNPPAG